MHNFLIACIVFSQSPDAERQMVKISLQRSPPTPHYFQWNEVASYWELQESQVKRFRRINRIAKGRICSLYGQVPQEYGMCLDAIAFLIIICGI